MYTDKKEMNLVDSIIELRNRKSHYTAIRKKGYYRKLLILIALIPCKILTLEQLNLLLDYEGNGNQIRKELSSLCRTGELIRESFLYNDRFAAYSLSPAGLKWLMDELSLHVNQNIPITNEFLSAEYRKNYNRSISNHTICINQIIISIICAAPKALETTIEIEKAFGINTLQFSIANMKQINQLVPDVFFTLHDTFIFAEADTLSVHFNAPKGPNDKVKRYFLFADLLKKSNRSNPIHLLFSIQKNWNYQHNYSEFSDLESQLLRNPEKLNNAITTIRLIASFIFNGQKTISLVEIWTGLKESVYLFDDSLKHSSLLQSASTLLNCLCRTGYGNENLSQIRKCCTIQRKKLQSMSMETQTSSALSDCSKRRKELLDTIQSDVNYYKSVCSGVSLSCCAGIKLTASFPFLFPKAFFGDVLITNLFTQLGIMYETDSIKSCPHPLSIKDSTSDLILNNTYTIKSQANDIRYVCIENISEDIGGFIRADQFMHMNVSKNILLLMLIDDSFQLADGFQLSKSSFSESFPIDYRLDQLPINGVQFKIISYSYFISH